MLVLGRTIDESIVIVIDGKTVATITVVAFSSRNKVRLGIDAPPHVSVLRSELIGKEPK